MQFLPSLWFDFLKRIPITFQKKLDHPQHFTKNLPSIKTMYFCNVWYLFFYNALFELPFRTYFCIFFTSCSDM